MKMHRPAWRNGLNRPNIVAVASTSNDDSWNAAIGKEKVRVTADERVVLFEFGVDPVRTTTTTTEVEDDETKMQKREEEVARADDEAFVESVVSLTAEQSQEEESVEETAVPKPKTTTTTTTTPSLSKMKKAELVALCEELGVDSTGTVPALRGRLGPVLRARAK
jgi:Lon protease-like protein